MLKFKKLRKTPYSRKHNIETYKIYKAKGGTNIHTTHEWVIGTHAIAVSKPDIKVIKSLTKRNNVEIIVKIQDITDGRKFKLESIENEVKWSKKLSGRTNFINYFDRINCKDNINKYKKNLKKISLCEKNGKNRVHIMFIEFIDGNMIKKGTKNNLFYKLTIKQYISYITRTYLALIQAYQELDFLHNDLNDVNLMIRKTKEKNQKYKINGQEITIETLGYEPIIIDFGRSDSAYKNDKKMIDDIVVLTSTFMGSITSDKLKNREIIDIYETFAYNIKKNKKKLTIIKFMKELEEWVNNTNKKII